MNDRLILAPLRGVTGQQFRSTFLRHFTGLDRAVAPFIPTVAGEKIKPALLKEIDPALNAPELPLTPQVIGRDPEQLRVMLHAIRTLGYTTCDLNCGCPYPFITKKGRGSGLPADEKRFAAMLETGCETMPGGFSIKIRLGLKTPDLLIKRMAIINAFPLCEVTIHPRTASQMYEGSTDPQRFAEAAAACRHPIVYNGDIRTVADFTRFKALFPTIDHWMIGRWVAANPFLPEMIKTGEDTRTPERLHAFLSDYFETCRATSCGDAPLLGRMKELWSYLHLGLHQGQRLWDMIKICRTADEYHRIVAPARFRFQPITP